MVYDIFYGEISEKRKENWDNGDDNPLEVLTSLKRIQGINWLSFLYLADQNLRDRIKIDWGSFAWKGSKEEILKLVQEWHGEFEDESLLVDGVEYGVVFIEMY